MRNIAIIQARLNSTRLPGKIMYKINNIPVIEILYKRLKKSKKLDDVIIATNKKSIDLINFLMLYHPYSNQSYNFQIKFNI